jgi:hypothetical protein
MDTPAQSTLGFASPSFFPEAAPAMDTPAQSSPPLSPMQPPASFLPPASVSEPAAARISGSMLDQAYSALVNLDAFTDNAAGRSNPLETSISTTANLSLADMKARTATVRIFC